MRVRWLIVTALTVASAAWAQSDSTQHVFQLSNSDSVRAREIASAVQTMLAPQAMLDQKGTAIALPIAPPDMALAQWLIEGLDKPAEAQDVAMDLYPGTAAGAPSVAIFQLPKQEPSQTFSEIVNAARTIPEITDLYPVGFATSPTKAQPQALVARAPLRNLQMAEWFLRQLESGGPGSLAAAAKFPTMGNPEAMRQHPEMFPDHIEARVLYSREKLPVQTFQEIVNAIRTIPELTKVFPVTGKAAIALDGDPDRVALAEWLFEQLDRTAPDPSASSRSHDAPSGDTAEVFFLPALGTEDNFRGVVTRLRTATRMTHVFPCTSTRAVVVRGTPAQLSQAADIVKEAAQ